jgi:hypothetical protein
MNNSQLSETIMAWISTRNRVGKQGYHNYKMLNQIIDEIKLKGALSDKIVIFFYP